MASNAQADVRFARHRVDGASSVFDVLIRDRKTGKETTINDLRLPMPGRHNVSNATAAIAVAHELGLSDEAIKKGLGAFGGVKRRFTRTGSWNGVEIFDDYGHHPVEIKAVLKAARDSTRRDVSSPSRSRTASPACMTCSTTFPPASTMPIR